MILTGEICEETKNRLGSNKIRIELKKKGIYTSISKVGKILKENSIGYRYTKPNESQNETIHKNILKRNLLKRHFFQNKPNAVLVSYFIMIKINSAKFYLSVILDLFSRKVIGYRLSRKLDLNLALKKFKDAYTSRDESINLMFHSDRGPRYLSHSFQDALKALGVKQSLSDPATPYDNAVIESFFSNLKREEVYKRDYVDYDDLLHSIDYYMDFYNNKRPHKTLNYKTQTDFKMIIIS